ncbi:MAG: isoaspartyl peptidase/L-asparaginase, partial [Nitrospirota bacterium]
MAIRLSSAIICSYMAKNRELVIAVHGGAGFKKAKKGQLDCIEEVIRTGISILRDGGSGLDAVEKMIILMEDSGLFNAGSGSHLQMDGAARMDASIMEGKDLMAGAVASVSGIANPIACARLIMDKSLHIMLAGEGARRFGAHYNLRELRSIDKEGLKAVKRSLDSGGDQARLYKSVYGCETVGAVA